MDTPSVLIAGRYRLVRRVGSGGMGVVWEAWDERLHRTVAVKQLHAQPGLNPADTHLANERAMREARITARLDHPNAVPVFDVVEHDDQPCLIMQFLPSEPLSAVLKEKKKLPFDEAARIGAQVASALAAAHRLGIVHRDVKPGNVLIAENGTARISDFGISHALGDVTLTSTGMVHGTPAYLAPEVARGSDSTFSSDVFGLGATLYAAVEGRPPFGTNQNSIALLYKVASGDFDPPDPDSPLSPLLLRMLSPDPADRPAMGDVAMALSGMTDRARAPRIAEEPTKVLPPAGPPPTPVPPAPAVLPLASPTATSAASPAASSAAFSPASSAAAEPTTRTVASAGDTPAGPPPGDDLAWSSSHEPSGGGRGPGRTVVRTALVLALLAGIVVLLVNVVPMLRTGSGAGRQGAAPAPVSPSANATSAEPSANAQSSASTSPSRSSASPTPTTPSPRPTPTRSPSPSPTPTESEDDDDAPTAAQLSQAITSYYGVMPGDIDAGWSRLSSSYRNQTGRSSYERFWGSIDRVSVSNAEGDPPNKAEATITYRFKDGRTVRERTSYGLVEDDGELKINTSKVITSSTTRS